jgi:hypothetical protein
MARGRDGASWSATGGQTGEQEGKGLFALTASQGGEEMDWQGNRGKREVKYDISVTWLET